MFELTDCARRGGIIVSIVLGLGLAFGVWVEVVGVWMEGASERGDQVWVREREVGRPRGLDAGESKEGGREGDGRFLYMYDEGGIRWVRNQWYFALHRYCP